VAGAGGVCAAAATHASNVRQSTTVFFIPPSLVADLSKTQNVPGGYRALALDAARCGKVLAHCKISAGDQQLTMRLAGMPASRACATA